MNYFQLFGATFCTKQLKNVFLYQLTKNIFSGFKTYMNIQSYNPSFQANINSRKLNFNRADFYVRIRGYGKDADWARKIVETADVAVKMIRKDTFIENILRFITTGVVKANSLSRDINKVKHTGILRCEREHWRSGSDWTGRELATNYSSIPRYSVYNDRFDETFFHPLRKPFADMSLTIPIISRDEKYLRHAEPEHINNVFEHIFKAYDNFKSKFNSKDVKASQLQEINENIGGIRWLLAHATPWERGSDAIANVLMRAMYKSLGIKTYPLKKRVSLDLEAFCTDFNVYKKNFGDYFEKPPKIIE